MSILTRVAFALLCGVVLHSSAQQALPLTLLAPQAGTTARPMVHVLGRTAPDATVRVAGEPARVFATGVFVRDGVPLAMGANRLLVEATGADGSTANVTLEIERIAPPPNADWPVDRLWLDGSSLQPDQLLRVVPGETVEVSLRATPGQRVEARLSGQAWTTLSEARPGRYRGLLRPAGSTDAEPAPVQVRVTAAAPAGRERTAVVIAQTPGTVGLWRDDPDRLVVVGPDGAELLHGLHEVRLGGPSLADLPPGTLLAVTGQRGEQLRVALSPDTTAWVVATAVQAAPTGTAPPKAFFTTLSVSSTAEGDVVQIPLAAAVPYAVHALSDAASRHSLEVDIYSAHHATTWITHRATAAVVREVTAEQAGPGRVRLTVALQGQRLWGWRVERTATALRITLRPPPVLAREGSPLAGLRVALEAGHGSADNLGAVGATGTPEKDINRWTTEALKTALEAVGAQVTMVREGDDNPNLRERARRVTASDAQLFVSVHANATDTGNGYLRVSGTSTYYKHASGRDLAAAVQRQMLSATGLDDFGLVGNFNYAPIRLVTWMPAVLVEQAFVTHPGDEARLLDPTFRALTAQAVRRGLEDFLRLPR